MIRKITLGLAGLLGLLLLLLLTSYLATQPEALPDDSDSAQWLNPGPFSVAQLELVLVDETRGTAANSAAPALPNRTFPTSIWYPENGTGSYPLVVHSHGFVSKRSDLGYVAELLASYGYVVAAANYPLTSGTADGGPNANDLVNQPADVSFLIDSLLELAPSTKPFVGDIDQTRIGLMGYSLGGITTSLATYHPRLRDDRVSAAISIAGPSAGLASKFYQSSDVPFMMIAGTADALVAFDANAAVIPQRIADSVLIAISGGTHLGFGSIAEPWLRLMKQPDRIGCAAVLSNLDADPLAAFIPLGDESDGIQLNADIPAVCETMPSEKALHPARQHWITSIAVLSFFESVFAEDADQRANAFDQLSSSLDSDFPEVRFSGEANPTRLLLLDE